MWRNRLYLLLVIVLTAIPFPAHAEDTTTIYAPSGRYSIDVPAGWVFDQVTPFSTQFPGESLMAASSPDLLDAYDTGQPIDGSMVIIYMTPIDVYRTYLMGPDLTPQYDLAGKTGDDLLEALYIRGAPMHVDGYPARRYRERGGGFFGETVHYGETAVLVGHFLYYISYTSPDMADTEAMVDTLKFYTETEPAPDIERDPLVLENGTFDLEPGWFVTRWDYGVPLISTGIPTNNASRGYYYTILDEKMDDFLPLLYPTLQINRMSSSSPVDLPSLYIMIGFHPYDQLFGSADVAVDQSQRERAFRIILNAAEATAASDPELAVVEGTPALTAPLDQVFGRPNQGQLTIVNSNYSFYSVLVAAPADAWDQARADALLARFHVNSPTPLAAGETGTGVQIGLYAPDFTLPLVDGSTVSLSDYRGKVVLLNFWATWCSPCTEEMDEFQTYYVEHSDEAVILAVDYSEPTEDVAQFVEENGLTYPVALDLDGAINELYRVRGYPTTYVINADGVIDAIPFANMDSVNEIARLVNAALR